MLATIVLDAYKESELPEMAEAIEGITCYDCWSSAGIYCFWDFDTKEILYFGLSTDLFERFRQHNGLIKCSPKACKRKQVQEYFLNKEKLGYSMMLQTSLMQPLTRKYIKRRKITFDDPDVDYSNLLESKALQNIRFNEGINIESAKQRDGFMPKWNIKGSFEERRKVTHKDYKLTELLSNKLINDNVSRASIRELNDNGEYRIFECFLHGVRISPIPIKETIELNREIGNGFIIDLLLSSGYLQKKLVI